MDLLIEDIIVVDLKAMDQLTPIHSAQLPTYLKLTKEPKGLLINFNTENITKSLVSLVTEEFSKPPIHL